MDGCDSQPQGFGYCRISQLPFGIFIAYILARGNFWGRALLNGIVHLPLILPPVVTGYLLLISFGRRGAIGSFLESWFGLVFSFRWTGVSTGLRRHGFPIDGSFDPSFSGSHRHATEEAAGTLGASRQWSSSHHSAAHAARHHRRLVLACAKAMGEFGATITFVSNIRVKPRRFRRQFIHSHKCLAAMRVPSV